MFVFHLAEADLLFILPEVTGIAAVMCAFLISVSCFSHKPVFLVFVRRPPSLPPSLGFEELALPSDALSSDTACTRPTAAGAHSPSASSRAVCFLVVRARERARYSLVLTNSVSLIYRCSASGLLTTRAEAHEGGRRTSSPSPGRRGAVGRGGLSRGASKGEPKSPCDCSPAGELSWKYVVGPFVSSTSGRVVGAFARACPSDFIGT